MWYLFDRSRVGEQETLYDVETEFAYFDKTNVS